MYPDRLNKFIWILIRILELPANSFTSILIEKEYKKIYRGKFFKFFHLSGVFFHQFNFFDKFVMRILCFGFRSLLNSQINPASEKQHIYFQLKKKQGLFSETF
jgi:hypothetical protein